MLEGLFDTEESYTWKSVELEMLLVDEQALHREFYFGLPPLEQVLSKGVPILSRDAVVNSYRRGRPPKWDWEAILREVILLANKPDGLPDTQAELEDWVKRKCSEVYGGEEPSPSMIRRKIAPLYQELRGTGP